MHGFITRAFIENMGQTLLKNVLYSKTGCLGNGGPFLGRENRFSVLGSTQKNGSRKRKNMDFYLKMVMI